MRVLKQSDQAESRAASRAVAYATPRPASIDLIVLSGDPALLSLLQAAADTRLLFWSAPSADLAVEHLVAGRCGILLIDLVHLRGDVAVLLGRLANQFPGLVLMVAGRREDEAAVSQLLMQGIVYRYVHKPLSPGRAEQFLSAAIRRHGELNEREPLGLATVRELVRVQLWQRLFRHSVRVMGVVSACVIAALVISTIHQARQSKSELPLQVAPNASATPALPVPTPLTAAPPQSNTESIARSTPTPLDRQLARAQQALNAGRLDDALGAVRQAANLAPDDTRVLIAATVVGERLVAQANAALAQGKLLVAQEHLQAARGLDGDLSLQLPDLNTTTRAFEQLWTEAESKALEAMLAIARTRREVGELLVPAGASAYDQLMLARSHAPNAEAVNAEAQELAFALVQAAEEAVADHRFDAATALLDRTDELVPGMKAARELRTQLALLQSPAAAQEPIP